MMVVGSSPLTRGKRLLSGSRISEHGLIPTHAGKTIVTTSRGSDARAHPRSRGENVIWPWLMASRKGSSPLMRGKLSGELVNRGAARLIPAHAGKTPGDSARRTGAGAHPHSRGENSLPYSSIVLWKGSSPLMRGKHFLTYAFIAQIGQTLESPELCVSSESYSPREPAPPATSRNARAASRARSSSPHSRQPTRWSIRSRRGQTPLSA